MVQERIKKLFPSLAFLFERIAQTAAMNISRIKETCIYVTDLEKTKAFYTGILGLPLISLAKERHVFFRAGESVLLCFIAEKTAQEKELPPHGASGCIHFAFEVKGEDYPAALQKIKEANLSLLHEHTWPNGLHSFYFHDPDGHLVEIIEEGLWERRG
jgi:catechol 2,3-dioxygenase-like lactoylglutathione lyase family enzyme